MQPKANVTFASQVSYEWKQSLSPTFQYTTGVSLHSHTSLSVESLTFIHGMFLKYPLLKMVFRQYERISKDRYGVTLDFVAAHWCPPLVPRMAFDLESRQIRSLGLMPLVSITDHDNIQAPLLLRTVPSSRHIPVSLEWTAPFGATAFHLGIHNLPSATAQQWMQRFATFTEQPDDRTLHTMLQELHADPHILIVLNHPLWDLYDIGEARHNAELDRFLGENNDFMHALELNALRHARENELVSHLAARWSQLLISGGDRHGLEPNANINLTNAKTFQQFVDEIRIERRSHVHFLQQYSGIWEQRIMDSTVDAVVNHPQFSPGWQHWDERAFHPDKDGVMRPLAELWPRGRAPRLLQCAIAIVRLTRFRTVSAAIRLGLRHTHPQLPESVTHRAM